MQSESNRPYIEAIKLAAGSVQYKNLSVKTTFMNTISHLYQHYTNSGNIQYLETATLHIQAYLEMGFPYDDGEELYNLILEKLGTTKELKFPRKFYSAKKIKLNKAQVKSMIKKWPASSHQKMKIDEVVADIIKKVRKKENGIFYYECVVTNDMYEGSSLFHVGNLIFFI